MYPPQKILFPSPKWLLAGLLLLLAFLGIRQASQPTNLEEADKTNAGSVNAVLGNQSFAHRFGRQPTPQDAEDLRIRTHLAYVEKLLRSRPVHHLSEKLQQARERNLDRLRTYWKRGIFPRNKAYPDERRPTFIDEAGRICAVGYLVARSAGWDVAKKINAAHQYDLIQEIDAPVLDRWAATSGLTKRELAMIQPAYRCCTIEPEESEKMDKRIEIASIGLNASAALLNGILLARHQPSYVASGAGLALGASGVAVGLSDRANFTEADLAFAAAALLTSGWSLTRRWHMRQAESAGPAFIPEMQPALISTRQGPPGTGLLLRWKL